MRSVAAEALARLILGPSFLVAFGLLVRSYSAPGDGFSAGVIAGLAIVLQYITFGYDDVERRLPVRYAPLVTYVGLLLSLLVVFFPLVQGRPIVSHWPPPGRDVEVTYVGGLELHTALLFDVGVFMLVLGFTVTATRLLGQVEKQTP